MEGSLTDCMEFLGSCVATVSDVETCIEEQRAALEACELVNGPACERLGRLCEDGSGDGAVSQPAPVQCIPGELEQCTCGGGAPGARECTVSGEYGPCACDVPVVVCVEGATSACAS